MKTATKYIIFTAIMLFIALGLISYWTILPRTGTVEIQGSGVYTGQLRGMTFHGYGTYISYTVGGVSYEGEWDNGVFHGQGTLTFANGSKLVGEFKNGVIQGIGESICPDGHITEYDFGETTFIGGCSCSVCDPDR